MSEFRGHQIFRRGDEWFFSDNGEPVATTWQDRPCGHCDKRNTPEGHDGCLGTLPGVVNACCGHGCREESYIQFENGVTLRGFRMSPPTATP